MCAFKNCLLLVFLYATPLISLNIDDFGALPNNKSFDAAVINGKAIYSAILTANNGPDRTVIIDGVGGKVYTMVPGGIIYNLVNVTIQIDGRVNAWDGDESKWPLTSTGSPIAMFSMINTQNLIIRGSGIVVSELVHFIQKNQFTSAFAKVLVSRFRSLIHLFL